MLDSLISSNTHHGAPLLQPYTTRLLHLCLQVNTGLCDGLSVANNTAGGASNGFNQSVLVPASLLKRKYINEISVLSVCWFLTASCPGLSSESVRETVAVHTRPAISNIRVDIQRYDVCFLWPDGFLRNVLFYLFFPTTLFTAFHQQRAAGPGRDGKLKNSLENISRALSVD